MAVEFASSPVEFECQSIFNCNCNCNCELAFQLPTVNFPTFNLECVMEVPLTPLEFMRRTRRLYADREGVVDGAHRWTYGAFFDRCDRWSSQLQRLGVLQDKVKCLGYFVA